MFPNPKSVTLMPLFAIHLSESVFSSIKELIDARKYRDVEAFIEVAAINQLALERGTSPDELVSRGHRAGVRDGQKSEQETETASARNGETHRSRENGKARKTTSGRISKTTFIIEKKPAQEAAVEIFQPFARHTEGRAILVPLAETPSNENSEHVFGQVNRLFPFKVACRGIANLALSNGQHWPEYSLVHDVVGEHAAKLGSLLEKWDREFNRKRDEQLATGLPKRGNSASRDRFLSQLVARVTRAGDVYTGAICQYQLAAFQGERVALTPEGLEFAFIENPILDSGDPSIKASLGQEEVLFLTKQIVGRVPAERADMRTVLQEISNGKTTPNELNDAVRANLPSEWTEGMTLTHISGLVARLADLGLIRRKWDGRYVKYELGDRQRIDAFLEH